MQNSRHGNKLIFNIPDQCVCFIILKTGFLDLRQIPKLINPMTFVILSAIKFF